MANTSSAKRANRVAIRNAEVNKGRRTNMRSTVRKVEEAITAGKKDEAAALMKTAEPALMKSSQKGVVHKKSASRKVSRLTARIRAMNA